MTNAYAFFGDAASRSAVEIDSVFVFILAVCLFFFLLVEGLLIVFAVKYRRRKGAEAIATSDVTHNALLEILWVIIPSVVVVAFFVYGYLVFRDIRSPRAGADEVNVVAQQFFYTFEYPNGTKSIGELRVPLGKPVKLIMTSRDVLHGFFIPEFRLKQDIVPGTYVTLWLQPSRAGTYDIYCTQYCGVGHSAMRAKLIVMEPADYSRWVASAGAPAGASLAARGKELAEKSGCFGCHTTTGSPGVGPTWRGLFGRNVALSDGRTVTADEAYLRESIVDPGAKIVKGFPNVMPTYKGSLSDDDVAAIIAYIKTLLPGGEATGTGKEGEEREDAKAGAAPSAGKGRALAERLGCLGCHSTDGSTKDGPTWKGLYGSRVPLDVGRTVVADDAYIKESILDPGAKIVKGFPNIMPSFKGNVSDRDVADLVAFIKTLK